MNVLTAVTDGIDLGGALTTAAPTFFESINGAIGPSLLIAIPVMALYAGWRIFRRFSKAS